MPIYINFLTKGVSSSMNSSEFVRQELRAVVSGRTQQQLNNARTPHSPIGAAGVNTSNSGGGNVMMSANTNNGSNAVGNTVANNPAMTMVTQSQMSNPMMNTTADMGFNFDLPTPGKFHLFIYTRIFIQTNSIISV